MRLLRLFYLVIFVVAGTLAVLWISHKTSPNSRMDNLYRFLVFDRPLSDDEHQPIIVFGDSQIAFAPWRLLYPLYGIANRGVVGETTGEMLTRDWQLCQSPRETSVILAGTNDVRFGVAEKIAEANFSKLLKEATGCARKVIAASLLPIGQKDLRARIAIFNRFIQRECSTYTNCHYSDLHAILDDGDGGLPSIYTRDGGLHLSQIGYWRIRHVLLD